MSEDKNHIEPLKELSPQLMQAYATGSLSPAEQYQVEKYLLDHPFEAEAIEGYLTQTSAFEDLAGLDKRLQERIDAEKEGAKIVPVWRKALPYAAVFSLLIVATIIATLLISKQEEMNPISLQKNDVLPPEQPSQTMNPPSALQKETEEEESEDLTYSAPTNDTDISLSKIPLEKEEKIVFEEVPENFVVEEIEQISDEEEQTSEEISHQLQGKVAGVQTKEFKAEIDTQILTSYASPKTLSTKPNVERAKKALAEIKVKGKVTDAESGEALPGVNVMIKNSSVGVNTDLDGNFQIEAAPDDILVVSFIGMEKEEVAVDARAEIEVALHSDVAQLSEVVVTAYGEQNEKDATYQSAWPAIGFSDFKDYIKRNLRYPEEAKENKTEGNVVLKITISSTGNIIDIEVIKSLGNGCDEEAIRLIKEGPDWMPAKRGEQPTESTQRIRIKFKL